MTIAPSASRESVPGTTAQLVIRLLRETRQAGRQRVRFRTSQTAHAGWRDRIALDHALETLRAPVQTAASLEFDDIGDAGRRATTPNLSASLDA